jgi:hypothetical protein
MRGEIIMVSYRLLRLSASILFGGVLVSILAGLFHPDREPANTHPAVFSEYAGSDIWTLVHLGQFIGMAGIIAGLVVMSFAFEENESGSGWLNRLARFAAMVALALYGVLQAVDGVALKQAVNAWATAPEAEKLMRFSSAETVRWLEWGARSYQSFMFGLTLVLFGAVIVFSSRISKPVGYLMGLSGLAYLYQGWVIGSEGFSMSNHLPTLLGIVAILVWSPGF